MRVGDSVGERNDNVVRESGVSSSLFVLVTFIFADGLKWIKWRVDKIHESTTCFQGV